MHQKLEGKQQYLLRNNCTSSRPTIANLEENEMDQG